MAENTTPIVVILGETASGKSSLALRLAQHFNGELICADSWTVYRGFDVGTAKPSADERALVPHHLLDIADPAEGFSVVRFKAAAQQSIDDIGRRGKLPILVGGTGLYIDSVLFDYQFLQQPSDVQRQELNELSLSELLHRAIMDGYDTSTIDIRNKRRLIRLIESQGQQAVRSALRPNSLLLGLSVDRDTLRRQVEHRVDAMLAAGLESEVRHLVGQYGWEAEPMKGIGYREWRPYIEGFSHADGRLQPQSLAETRQRIIAGTMGLAKRQRTWFKRNPAINWLEPPGIEGKSVELVATFYNG